MEDSTASGEAIQVVVRVRPCKDNEVHCVHTASNTSLVVQSKPTPKQFTYDYVADQNASQQDMFEQVGRTITDRAISGYNGTIFAYGQTGSGKTYTMNGDPDVPERRGLIPRVLDYLFQRVHEIEEASTTVKFLIKCSYLEIYNERCGDLLNPNSSSNIMIQEDLGKAGIQIVNLSEEVVCNSKEAVDLLTFGSTNRSIACTAMNRESSRSHAVFTLYIQSSERIGNKTITKQSRFNLVDLAGSERQKDSKASGIHLKEAGQINRSLSVLGNVIQALVDIGKGKTRHVHYRDSKLTFLLKDSLGGNSLTFLIATVSPLGTMLGETMSTLKFASRTKTIRNQAVVNAMDLSGSTANELFLAQQNRDLMSKIQELQQRVDSGRDQTGDDKMTRVVLRLNEDLEKKCKMLTEAAQDLEEKCTNQHYADQTAQKLLLQRISFFKDMIGEVGLTEGRISQLEKNYQKEYALFHEKLVTNLPLARAHFELTRIREKLSAQSETKLQVLSSYNESLTQKCGALMESNAALKNDKLWLEEENVLKSANQENVDALREELEAERSEFEERIETMELNFQQTLKSLSDELVIKSRALEKANADLELETSKAQNRKDTLDGKDDLSLQELEETMIFLYEEIEDLKTENETLSGLLREIAKQKEELKTRRRKSALFNSQNMEQLEEYKDHLVVMYEELEETQHSMVTSKEEFSGTVHEYEEIMFDLLDAVENSNTDTEKLSAVIASLTNENSSLGSKVAELQSEVKILTSKLDRAQCDLEILEDDNECVLDQLRFTENELSSANQRLSQVQTSSDQTGELETLPEDYEKLVEFAHRTEGKLLELASENQVLHERLLASSSAFSPPVNDASHDLMLQSSRKMAKVLDENTKMYSNNLAQNRSITALKDDIRQLTEKQGELKYQLGLPQGDVL